jgi:hypothetical protein
MLRAQGLAALMSPRLSILEEVLPLALQSLAESYDRNGIVGDEVQYFDLAQELWRFMSGTERSIPEMVCTFLYAGCKFNQPAFVRWILPIAAAHPAVDAPALVGDRSYSFNQLRHSAVYYIARNGNIELHDLMTTACGGVSPLLLEASYYDAQAVGITVATTAARPRGQSAGAASSVGDMFASDTMLASGVKGSETPDPPSLYVALKAGKTAFVRHALCSLPAQAQARVLRLACVYGFIPSDDAEGAQELHRIACERGLLPPDEAGVTASVADAATCVFAFGAGRDESQGPAHAAARSRTVSDTTGTASIWSAVSDGTAGSTAIPPHVSSNVSPAPLLSSKPGDLFAPFYCYALHLCLFTGEGTAEPGMRRRRPALRYAAWLLRTFRGDVLAPLARMRWSGAAVLLASGGGGAGDSGVDDLRLRVRSTAAHANSQWSHWSALHSAAAAPCPELCQRIVAVAREQLQGPALSLAAGAPHVQLFPVRVAVEGALWSGAFEVARTLAQWLSPQQLELQLYAPARALGLVSHRPAFVKTLCKEAGCLALRSFRTGPAAPLALSAGGSEAWRLPGEGDEFPRLVEQNEEDDNGPSPSPHVHFRSATPRAAEVGSEDEGGRASPPAEPAVSLTAIAGSNAARLAKLSLEKRDARVRGASFTSTRGSEGGKAADGSRRGSIGHIAWEDDLPRPNVTDAPAAGGEFTVIHRRGVRRGRGPGSTGGERLLPTTPPNVYSAPPAVTPARAAEAESVAAAAEASSAAAADAGQVARDAQIADSVRRSRSMAGLAVLSHSPERTGKKSSTGSPGGAGPPLRSSREAVPFSLSRVETGGATILPGPAASGRRWQDGIPRGSTMAHSDAIDAGLTAALGLQPAAEGAALPLPLLDLFVSPARVPHAATVVAPVATQLSVQMTPATLLGASVGPLRSAVYRGNWGLLPSTVAAIDIRAISLAPWLPEVLTALSAGWPSPGKLAAIVKAGVPSHLRDAAGQSQGGASSSPFGMLTRCYAHGMSADGVLLLAEELPEEEELLGELLPTDLPVPPPPATTDQGSRIVEGLCSVLATLHGSGVTHGCVHPSSVHVSTDGSVQLSHALHVHAWLDGALSAAAHSDGKSDATCLSRLSACLSGILAYSGDYCAPECLIALHEAVQAASAPGASLPHALACGRLVQASLCSRANDAFAAGLTLYTLLSPGRVGHAFGPPWARQSACLTGLQRAAGEGRSSMLSQEGAASLRGLGHAHVAYITALLSAQPQDRPAFASAMRSATG